MNNAIVCQDLKKKYGKQFALNGLDLQIPQGTVYGLLGPNGSGKTTFLRLVMNLLQADEGELTVLGHAPKDLPMALREKIGYSSSTLPLVPWLRAGELLKYNGAFYPRWDQTYVETWIQRLGLNLNKRVFGLSRGEKQKLGFLMAIGHRPELLILDEPTEGLDPIARQEFMESLIELLHESGTTVVLSSHLMNDVERVAENVGFIYHGQVRVQDNLDDLKLRIRRVSVYHNEPITLPFEQFKNPRTFSGLTQGLCLDWDAQKVRQWEHQTGLSIQAESLSLEDIFVSLHQNEGVPA